MVGSGRKSILRARKLFEPRIVRVFLWCLCRDERRQGIGRRHDNRLHLPARAVDDLSTLTSHWPVADTTPGGLGGGLWLLNAPMR